MKPSVKSDQKVLTKRADKKNINIRWNSRLYFQIGLILSLLAVFLVMEIEFEVKPNPISDGGTGMILDPATIQYRVEEPVKQPVAVVKTPVVKPPVRQKVQATTFTPVDNLVKTDGPDIAPTDTPITNTDPDPNAGVVTPTPPINTGTTNVLNVEHVPVFPGCESVVGNKAKVDCMSSKIAAFVSRKFRTEDFEDLSGDPIQRIFVQFTINKRGEVVDIKARSKHSALENEAKRVIDELPEMKPGRQGESNVDVIYMVPITLQLNY